MLKVVHEESQNVAQRHVLAAVGGSLLDELARDGARQMLAAALLAEVAAYVDAHAGEVDENGHRLVVRNGFHDSREVATAAGAVPVRQPRVNDKRIDEATGERKRFSSAILPAWARKSPGVAEVLPLLYLHGLSSGDFVPALARFLGLDRGLSAATDHQAHDAMAGGREGVRRDAVTVGVRLRVRVGRRGPLRRSASTRTRLCLLVMVGVRIGRHQGARWEGWSGVGVG